MTELVGWLLFIDPVGIMEEGDLFFQLSRRDLDLNLGQRFHLAGSDCNWQIFVRLGLKHRL